MINSNELCTDHVQSFVCTSVCYYFVLPGSVQLVEMDLGRVTFSLVSVHH